MKKTRREADGAVTFTIGRPLRDVAISKDWIQEHGTGKANNQ